MASFGVAQSPPLLRLLLLLVVLSGHAFSQVGALTINDLYPFGAANGDTVIKGGDDISSNLIPLPYPVPVFGLPGLNGAYVNLNGAVHFRSRSTSYDPHTHVFPTTSNNDDQLSMVAAFWTDLHADCDICTGMAFRVERNATKLAEIDIDIRGALPDEEIASGFNAKAALIATWVNVTQCCGTVNFPVITFQAVIAFDTRTVYVGLLYPELNFAGNNVQAGFNVGDGVRSFRLPTSLSTHTFDKQSNIGQAGKWWFGIDQSSNAIGGTFAYVDEPLPAEACTQVTLYGDTGWDACGQQRVMDWDFDADGVYDDATNTTSPVINTNILRPTQAGVYPISARVTSPSPCADEATNTLVLDTTLTLTLATQPPTITAINVDTVTGNPNPYVGEAVRVVPEIEVICLDYGIRIDCGEGSIAGVEADICRYGTKGVKTITVTLGQNGLITVDTVDIFVVEYKQACSPEEFPPGGRAVGRRGCSPTQWTSPGNRCSYPLIAGVKPTTPLWAAFASRAAQDAAVIRRFYGNRTMAETLRTRNNRADAFASEAAAALLNSLTLPYAQCPQAVKLAFRHALYRGVGSEEASSLFDRFLAQNSFPGGCTLPACA